jgi:MFS family permease
MAEFRGANGAVAGAAASEEKPLEFGKRYTWLGLGLLLGVSTVNLIDRSIVNLLLVPIAQDLDLKDWQLGVFTGPAFGIFYALSQIPIARLADRARRVTIIAVALAFWSTMTMVQAAAVGFLTLAMARALVAVGEAGSGPASQSIIADLFPVTQRARAFAIFSFQLPVGAAIGSFIGGWGRELLGWQPVLVLVGIPGLLLALIVYRYLREPTRGYWQAVNEPLRTATFAETVHFLIRLPAFRHTVIAYTVWVIAVAASSFDVVFLERSFGLKPSSIGTLVGIAGLLAMTGYFLAGWIADRLAARNSPWAPRLPAVFLLLHLVVALFYYNATSIQTVMVLVVTAPLIPATLPLVMNNIQSLAPPHMRAQAAALLLTTSTLIGMSIGPPLAGFLSDQFAGEFGKESMRYALMCMITVGWSWAALHYFLASRTFARDALAKDR